MSKKKSIILSVITIITLVLLVVGATYAYFKAQGGDPKSADIKVSSYTVDTFTFSVGNPISFTLDQDNFASGKGNRVGNTFAKVNLTANNKTNTATEHYYVYLNIENNTFTYSIDESTPEIIMTVTDSTGTEITDIAGLTHTSVKDASGTSISGYDITNKKGLITLFNNREITATPSKEEKWNISVTFVNYDASQNNNAGKSMSAKVMVQKEVIPQVVSDVCSSGDNLANCITSLYTKSTSAATNIYHHNSGLANGAGDNSYRYAGASSSVNNYICLDSSESTTCPDESLFRIIGLFNGKVKVIRTTSVGKKSWSGSSYNTWSRSTLNEYLNEEYLTSLGDLASKITTTTWKVGGNTGENIAGSVPATAYQNEIVNPQLGSYSKDNRTEYDAKIGLMYASDYGFAADPSAWTTSLYNYDSTSIKSVNWLYLGSYEWLISRNSAYSNMAFFVTSSGDVAYDYHTLSNYTSERPSFSLSASTTYVSGSGSADDPMVIN